MSKHDPILLFASKLLPPDAARDASALYAWCRRLDEIADDVDANANNNNDEDANMMSLVRRRLDEWEGRFDELVDGRPADGMDAELARYLRRRRRRQHDEDGTTGASSMVEVERPFRDMIAGMKSDAVDGPRTVESMEELEVYAYQVAGTVGLMLLPLLNADEEEEARAPAVALGKAIQLINILRDATPDAALGRVYLPRDVLASEGVSIDEVLNLQSSGGYRRAVERVADRAGELLAEAEVGRSTLPGSGPLFVQVIVELYRTYLVELERRGYDNLNAEGERVKIGTLRKAAASCRAIYATYSPF